MKKINYHLLQKTLLDKWSAVQSKYADIPGEEGVEQRRKVYAPYFLRFGNGITISEGCRFYHPNKISLDDDVRINICTFAYGSGGIHIGRHARIGPRCFIHSANHDTSVGEMAFFERGYVYKTVNIGDNCLISANVSILPGANIGAGSFAACSTVVAKGDYPENSNLMGVPAKNKTNINVQCEYQEAPSIALVTPQKGRFSEAAKLLITSLCLPQVRVFVEGEKLFSSIHTVIAFGPSDWSLSGCNLPVWKFARSKVFVTGPVKITACGREEGEEHFNLHDNLKHIYIPTIDNTKSDIQNITFLNFYNCFKRLTKKTKPLDNKETVDAYILLFTLNKFNISHDLEFISKLKCILKLNKDSISTNELVTKLKTIVMKSKSFSILNDALAKEQINPKKLLEEPHVMYALGLKESKYFSINILESIVNACLKAEHLSYVGLLANMLGYVDVVSNIKSKLFTSELLDRASMSIRNSAKVKSFCYSPVLTAFLIVVCRMEHPDFSPRFIREQHDKLYWHIFPHVDIEDWRIISNKAEGTLVSVEDKKISVSLLENWLAYLSVPSHPGTQYELLEHNYSSQSFSLELCWLRLFRYLQNSAGKPLVRIKPWPSGYKAAFSLRYDIDRATSTSDVRKIVTIQQKYLNANCASWFFMPGSAHNNKIRYLLSIFLQETGIHALKSEGDFQGKGVTMHSAPGTEYWRGCETVLGLEKAGALYGEMLTSQVAVPKPVWLEKCNEARMSRMWVLPIHFPLEGSTQETTLDYFDRLREYFVHLLQISGHLIISSHPDLNQEILVELLERENLEYLWRAPIATVVDRCKKLLSYGAISLVTVSDNVGLYIMSSHTIADVQIEIYFPDKYEPVIHCVQLNAGAPRKLLTEDNRDC